MGDPTYLQLRDTGGNVYSYEPFTALVKQQVGGQMLYGLRGQMNTQPGDKYSGLVIFQIPQSATPQSLIYNDYSNRIITISL
jgi:hypothetical protein